MIIIFSNGVIYYYEAIADGFALHRTNDKPAVFYPMGSVDYYINGIWQRQEKEL